MKNEHQSQPPTEPQEEPKKTDENKKTKFIKRVRKLDSHTISKEFNNPIYAGFEFFQENKESVLWGPWVIERQNSPLRKSHSLNVPIKLKSTQIQFQRKREERQTLSKKETEKKTPSRQQLPQIKQKGQETLKQIRFSSLQLLPKEQQSPVKQNNTKNKRHLADNKRIKYELKIREDYLRKAKMLGDLGKSTKMSTVVYNYCTDYQAEGSLLQYHRKKINELCKPISENLQSSESKIEKWNNNQKLLKKLNNNRYLY